MPTAPYRAVLFDWDGTLADTLPVWMRCYQWALHGWGLNPSPEKIAAQFGDWRGVLGLGVREDNFEAFWQLMHTYLDLQLPLADLYPHARDTLLALHEARVATALVTTANPRNLQQAFERHALQPLFDVVITGHDVTHHKPHPEPVQLALSKLGVEPHEAVMIGDSDKDLAAAAAAGVDSLLFYPAAHAAYYDLNQLRTHHPRHICSTWPDLAALLTS